MKNLLKWIVISLFIVPLIACSDLNMEELLNTVAQVPTEETDALDSTQTKQSSKKGADSYQDQTVNKESDSSKVDPQNPDNSPDEKSAKDDDKSTGEHDRPEHDDGEEHPDHEFSQTTDKETSKVFNGTPVDEELLIGEIDGLLLDPTRITAKNWKKMMGNVPAFENPSDKSDNNFRKAVEYCNRRSRSDGRTLAYSISSYGVITFLPDTDGYRLPQEWNERKDKHKGDLTSPPNFFNSIMDFLTQHDSKNDFPDEDEYNDEHYDDEYNDEHHDDEYNDEHYDDEYNDGHHEGNKRRPYTRYQHRDNRKKHGRNNNIFRPLWNGSIRGMAPPDFAQIEDSIPTLTWNAVAGAVHYKVQFKSRESDTSVHESVIVKEPAYTPPEALIPGGTYAWRVRAVNFNGQQGSWSKVLVFTVKTLETIEAINWVAPASGTVTYNERQPLEWNTVDKAVIYQVKLSSDMNTIAASETRVTTVESYVVQTDLDRGAWYWQVRALTESGTASEWTPIQNFTVSDGAVTLLEPSNALYSFDSSPVFSWNTAEGAESYRLQLAEEGTGFDNSSFIELSGIEHTFSEALNTGNYIWRVQAVDALGNAGDWSEIRSLSVVIDDPISGFLPIYAVADELRPTLSWNPVQHAYSYEIQLASSKSQLVDSSPIAVVDTSYNPTDNLDPYTAWYWRVRPLDMAGGTGHWSEVRVLVIYDSALETGANDMFSLANGAELNQVFSRQDAYIFIPGGTFDIKTGRADFPPYTNVTVTSFAMNQFEVTNQEYLAFLNSSEESITIQEAKKFAMNGIPIYGSLYNQSNKPAIKYDANTSPKFQFDAQSDSETNDTPASYISWYGAVQYANWLSISKGLTPVYTFGNDGDPNDVTMDLNANGYRLPTNAEWDYAAHGGPLNKGIEAYLDYAGSNIATEVGWYYDNSDTKLHGIEETIASLYPNYLNIYNLSGSVNEFTWDWIDDRFAFHDGLLQEYYTNQTDPTGFHLTTAREDNGRIIRGSDFRKAIGDHIKIHETSVFYTLSDSLSANPIKGIRLVRSYR